MLSARHRIAAAIVVVLIWIAITVNFGREWRGVKHPLNETLNAGFNWQIFSAGLLLLVAVIVFRWPDVGLAAPRSGTLKLAWFPMALITLFLSTGVVLGLPPISLLALMLVNSAMVGWSEEMAFRGVLFSALRTRFALWMAILLTCLAFGAVHILNGFSTGDFHSAFLQAATAAMGGLLFVALVVRTGSILPAMVVHTLWDYSLFVLLSSPYLVAEAAAAPSDDGSGVAQIVLPFVLELPNFLYALYLLRNVHRTVPAAVGAKA